MPEPTLRIDAPHDSKIASAIDAHTLTKTLMCLENENGDQFPIHLDQIPEVRHLLEFVEAKMRRVLLAPPVPAEPNVSIV